MGEYPVASGHHSTLARNLESSKETVGAMKTTPYHWMECIRIVDTVFTKVIQVQRVHMNLICAFVTSAGIWNNGELIEKQKEECKHLEEEIRSLKKTMLERVLCPETNRLDEVSMPRSFEEAVSPLPNIESSTSKCDPWVEVKQENDPELMDEKEDDGDLDFTVNSENRLESLQSPTSAMLVKEEIEEIPSISESVNAVERNSGLNINKYCANELLSDNYENSSETGDPIGTVYQSFVKNIHRSKEMTDYNISEAVASRVYGGSGSPTENETSEVAKQLPSSVHERSKNSRNDAQMKYVIRHIPLYNKQELRQIRNVGSSHKCELCGKVFSRKGNLTTHLRIHSNEKPYECEVCSKSFRESGALTKHMRIHNDEKPYECVICSKTYRQKENLVIHLRTHNGDKPYECKICSRKFIRNSTLTEHLRVHNGEKPYECEICLKRFSQKPNLNIHLRVHNGEKPYQCEVCSKKFSQRARLSNHLRIHSGEKPYECAICAKKFCLRSRLMDHMRVHNGEKRYECGICARKFRRNSALAVHLRIHNGEKPYECEVCLKKFSQKSHLTGHTQTHNGKKLGAKKFIQRWTL